MEYIGWSETQRNPPPPWNPPPIEHPRYPLAHSPRYSYYDTQLSFGAYERYGAGYARDPPPPPPGTGHGHSYGPYTSSSFEPARGPPGLGPYSSPVLEPALGSSRLGPGHGHGHSPYTSSAGAYLDGHLRYGAVPYERSYPMVDSVPAPAPPAYYSDPNASNWPPREAVRHYGVRTAPRATGVTIPSTRTGKFFGARRPVQLKRNSFKPKKIKSVQSAYCHICKVNCSSKEILKQHKLGKKHKKNLEKQTAAAAPVETVLGETVPAEIVPAEIVHAETAPIKTVFAESAPCKIAPAESVPPKTPPAESVLAKTAPLETVPAETAQTASNTALIGPQDNSSKGKGVAGKKNKKKGAESAEDLEIKKKKVVEGGAAVEAIKTCTICNVVCNSERVYNDHLVGHKHATMLKKQQLGQDKLQDKP